MIRGPAPGRPGKSDRKAVDVSTHRRAWKLRAGVVVALVAGALLTVPATPALAAPDVNNVAASPSTVEAGGTVKVSYSLSFSDPIGPADVSVTSSEGKLNCVDGCGGSRVDQNGTFQATFKLADDAADGTATITIKATDSNGPDKQTKEASTQVTLVGKPKPSPTPTQVQTVKSVSGKVVVTANSEPVPNATVMLLDSAQHRYQTTSDGSGNFRFVGSQSNPIVPGQIQLGASKETVLGTRSINASAGQSLTGQRISLAIPVEVKPSVSASASASASAAATAAPVPTEEPTEDTATQAPAAGAAPSQQAEAAASESDSGGASWLLILLGGLFVAVGVGTIVLLYMKRKENADDDGDVDGPAGAAAAGAVPAARGAYRGADDQTRVVNRVGAGPDPTMVGGAAMSDAPTMLQRPVVDDVPPDPYGAPPPAFGGGGAAGQPGWAGGGYGDEATGQGGYGGYGNAPASGGGYGAQGGYPNGPTSGGGYGNASGAGYGNAPASGAGYGNAPASGGGYGAPAGGYGGGQGAGGYGERFDEPTGRYTGEGTGSYTPPADPYPTSTYQPTGDPGHGYGQEPPSYGRAGEPGAGGYGTAQGAGQGAGYGGYDGGQQSGPGYGGGYDQQRGDAYPAQGSGYDQQRGGYDQRGGYGGGQDGGYGGGQPGGGYGEAPQQRGGGYDGAAYDQQQGGGYYNDQGQPGRGRADGPPPQQERGGRRLDWLDD
ncbi:carboxypeptidase regulatory-like domain-containing protein [Micromonospora mirobrigensis]|uniref:carboxypeptidase regulatory-like domain-containing protein n=1 Tax=Micromonospora mirobrigensis TaxID=262898 RepID=UPI000B87C445|nr:carboxypeptidase regulatory-like domain-containing protein [Micromonospora mirobrigensis]